MAKEKHKRGNKKSGGGRTNELNRRKKKFSTGGGRDDLREARTSENRSRFLLQFYDLNRPRSADILFDFASPCGEPGVSGRFYALLLRYTSARCTQPTTTFPPRSPSSSSRTSRQSWISISLSSSLLPVSSGLSARCYRGKEQFHPLYPCLTSPDHSILPLPFLSLSGLGRVQTARKHVQPISPGNSQNALDDDTRCISVGSR